VIENGSVLLSHSWLLAAPRLARRSAQRLVLAALASLALVGAVLAVASPAAADPSWTVTNPTVFGLGDSLFWQCGESLGLGDRSLGMIGWNGGTTQDMRDRMSSSTPDWPFMTESSHAEELADFRDAGTWVIGLGSNDIRISDASRFQANVEWFMQQAQGRPVEWFTLYYPAFGAKADQFNAVLQDAALRYSNLRLLDWNGFAAGHPAAIAEDRLHIADYTGGCEDGRFALIRANVPDVVDQPTPVYPSAPTTLPSPDPIAAEYDATGGAGGPLGDPTGSVICGLRYGGCKQSYTGGLVVWNPGTGAHALTQSAILAKYQSTRADMGLLGYPTDDTTCGLARGGCSQSFQGGTIYWSPASGAAYSTGLLDQRYRAMGAQNGVLGYPTMDTQCDLTTANGCYQDFQYRRLYWTASSGVHFIYGALYDRYAAAGWERGVLGFPVTDSICGLVRGGCYQGFTGGYIYSSATAGTHVTLGTIRDRWAAAGSERSGFGYPVTDTSCGLVRGGCYQHFEGGSIYSTPTAGTHIIYGALRDRWAAAGWERSGFGYPVTDSICGLVGGGCYQHFESGSMYSSPASGTRLIYGAIRDRWAAAGSERSGFGYPVTDSICGLVRGGCYQHFQGGSIYSAPGSGTHIVYGAIRDAWIAQGWEQGLLGYPVTDTICGLVGGGCYQHFESGSIYSSPASGTHISYGAIRDRWAAAGWERSGFGYPVTDAICGLVRGGCYQHFQGGSIYSTPTAGTHIIYGAIRDAWIAQGWQRGLLGYPVTDTICGLVRGGCYQHFEGGSIYSSPGSGTHIVYFGPMRDRWASTGWEAGPYGYPTSDQYRVSGGVAQRFQGGTLTLVGGRVR
jgi:uncharacterized protein with LGFP repeats